MTPAEDESRAAKPAEGEIVRPDEWWSCADCHHINAPRPACIMCDRKNPLWK